MFGAIAGDIIGSVFEHRPVKSVSLLSFFESDDFEAAVRKAISLGGDSDTMACIAGGIAQAYYGSIPAGIVKEVRARLPGEFLTIIDEFNERFEISNECRRQGYGIENVWVIVNWDLGFICYLDIVIWCFRAWRIETTHLCQPLG